MELSLVTKSLPQPAGNQAQPAAGAPQPPVEHTRKRRRATRHTPVREELDEKVPTIVALLVGRQGELQVRDVLSQLEASGVKVHYQTLATYLADRQKRLG